MEKYHSASGRSIERASGPALIYWDWRNGQGCSSGCKRSQSQPVVCGFMFAKNVAVLALKERDMRIIVATIARPSIESYSIVMHATAFPKLAGRQNSQEKFHTNPRKNLWRHFFHTN